MFYTEEKELTKQLEEGGVKYVQQEKLKGESFEVGAKVTFEGRAVTILEGKDDEGDYTIQDAFDEDGAIAGRLTEVHEELTDIGADSAEARASAEARSLYEEVIEGFEDGVLGMRPGGERVIEVPPSRGYGDSPPSGSKIPPGARLQFTVTLLSLC